MLFGFKYELINTFHWTLVKAFQKMVRPLHFKTVSCWTWVRSKHLTSVLKILNLGQYKMVVKAFCIKDRLPAASSVALLLWGMIGVILNYFVLQLHHHCFTLDTVQNWSLLECTGHADNNLSFFFFFFISIFNCSFLRAVYHNLHTCKYEDAKIKFYVC